MAAWGAKELGQGAGSPWGHLGLSPMTLLLPWLGDLAGGPNTREGKSAQCRVWKLLRGNFWPSRWPEELSLVFRGDTLTHWVISVLGGLPLHSPRPSPSPPSLPRRAVHSWDQHGAGGSCGGQSHGLGPDLLGCPLMGQNMVGVRAHRGTKGRERNRERYSGPLLAWLCLLLDEDSGDWRSVHLLAGDLRQVNHSPPRASFPF